MSEYKENQGEVLFTASVIVCVLRYLAILLPDMPFFAVLRSLEKAPQQYCLDFASIMIFIVNTCKVLSRNVEKGRLLYWTEGISFAALVPAWRYLVDLFDWLETGNLSELDMIIRNAAGIFKVIFISLAICFLIGFIIMLLRHHDSIKKCFYSCINFIKKDLFIAQFICIMIIIHAFRFGISFFAARNVNLSSWLLFEISSIDYVLVAAFFIALLLILFHCRKKEDAFTPAVWFAIVLCLFGIVPMRNNPSEMLHWFGIIVLLVVITVLLLSGYRYLRSGKIKETKLWKNFHGDKIIELIQQHLDELSGNFINVIFLPFRFLLSYIDMLGSALLDDDSEDNNSKNNNNNNSSSNSSNNNYNNSNYTNNKESHYEKEE